MLIKFGPAMLMVIIFLVGAASQYSQGPSAITAEQRKAANEQFSAGKWEQSEASYRAISKAEPQNPGASYRLGFSLHKLKKYDEAIGVYETTFGLNKNPSAAYNAACVYSILGKKESAFEWLEMAVAAGFSGLATFRSDDDLTSLRPDPRFKVIESSIERAAEPCRFDPSARQFDFWVGDWDVKTQQGQNAGTNTIQLLENGCILLENWTSSIAGTGKSINFYDKESKKWRQIWVDNAGNSTLFVGELTNGEMVYTADKLTPAGKPSLSRMTFTPIDKTHVRQHGESSLDAGKTWTTTFDFVYVLKSAKP